MRGERDLFTLSPRVIHKAGLIHTSPRHFSTRRARRLKTLFAEISKVEDLDDGTVNVFGVASSESRDHDEELIRSAAVKAALPEYLQYGNIREMHQAIAAGVAIEAHVDDDGVTHLAAHIVDPSSVKKVKAGVLKGFSLGGKVTKRNAKDKSIIEGLRITEISLVDRPANPDALITLAKFDANGRRKNVTAKAADETETDDVVEKGMWDVGDLAQLIQRLAGIQMSATAEAGWEKDGSSMPIKLKAAVQSLVDCLREMVDEETRELLGGMTDVIAMAKAVDTGELEKAGRRFSAKTVKSLAGVHKTMKDCCDMLDALGYEKADNPEDQDTPMTDAEKAAAEKAIDEKITKAVGTATEPLTKSVDDLKKSVAALTTENADLKTKLDASKAETVAANKVAQDIADSVVAKGFVKPVLKVDDGGDKKTEDVKKNEKPTDVGAEMKAAFAKPMSPIRGTAVVA